MSDSEASTASIKTKSITWVNNFPYIDHIFADSIILSIKNVTEELFLFPETEPCLFPNSVISTA